MLLWLCSCCFYSNCKALDYAFWFVFAVLLGLFCSSSPGEETHITPPLGREIFILGLLLCSCCFNSNCKAVYINAGFGSGLLFLFPLLLHRREFISWTPSCGDMLDDIFVLCKNWTHHHKYKHFFQISELFGCVRTFSEIFRSGNLVFTIFARLLLVGCS